MHVKEPSSLIVLREGIRPGELSPTPNFKQGEFTAGKKNLALDGTGSLGCPRLILT